jgi:hypothetical protein
VNKISHNVILWCGQNLELIKENSDMSRVAEAELSMNFADLDSDSYSAASVLNNVWSPDSGMQNSMASFIAAKQAKYSGKSSTGVRTSAVIEIESPAEIILFPTTSPPHRNMRNTFLGIEKSPSAVLIRSNVFVANFQGCDTISDVMTESNKVLDNCAAAPPSFQDCIGDSPSFSSAAAHKSMLVSLLAP